MNIFKKYKLAQLIDEKAEMLESYRTRIEKFYKENFICSTWVYHLSDKEFQSIGLKKPWECAYYKISGDPNPPLNPYLYVFNANLKRSPIYYGLSQEDIEKRKNPIMSIIVLCQLQKVGLKQLEHAKLWYSN